MIPQEILDLKFSPEYVASRKRDMLHFEAYRFLAETHPDGYVREFRPLPHGGFVYFPTWAASRRLRFPFGRQSASVVPWICTRSEMMRGTLTETMAQVTAIREKVSYNEMAVSIVEGLARRSVAGLNPRQGWTPDGQKLGEVV